MTIEYGLTSNNQAAINIKALNKNNGVYTFRGVAYRVVDNKVTHFADNGKVFQQYGVFNTIAGEYQHYMNYSAAAFLKTIKG